MPTDHEQTFGERRYMVNPSERLHELLFRDEIPDTAELTYSFNQGYERLTYRASADSGSLNFEGSYHPDGWCVGPNICRYCGRTLFDE